MVRALKSLLRCLLFLLACGPSRAADLPFLEEPTLELHMVGTSQLRVLSPTVLEVTLITTKAPDPAPVERWNLAAEDQLHRARDSAYGTSFPNETKRFRGGGWYFSANAAFDLAVASALDFPALNDPRDKFAEAIWPPRLWRDQLQRCLDRPLTRML